MKATPAQRRIAGIFLVAGALVCALFLLFFAKSRIAQPRMRLIALVANQSVSGLSEGGKVSLAGIDIGTIHSIAFVPGDARRIVVRMDVDPATPLFRGTTASLQVFGITGLKYLELEPGDPTKGRLGEGDTIQTKASLVDNIMETVDSMARVTNRVLETVSRVTSPERLAEIDSLIRNVSATADALADFTTSLRDARIEDDVKQVAGRLNSTIGLIDSTLRQTRPDLTLARVDSAAQAVNQAAGQANLIITRSQGDLFRSLEDLRLAMRNISEFSSSIRDNPSALIMRAERPQR